MNAKENLKAFYLRLPHDEMPTTNQGEISIYPPNGFLERPANNKGGKDWFGCEWEFIESAGAPAPDCSTHVLTDICNWREQVKFPDLDTWDWEEAVKLDKINELDRENNLINCVVLNGLWERMHVLMGFENALCSLLEEPEEVSAFLDALTDYKIKLIDKLAEYYQPDIIMFHDDWGTQSGPFFSPSVWRELIKPRQEKIIQRVHDHGMIFNQHSCGKYDDIIEDICEIGVDVLNCMDIMDIGAAIEKAKGKMAFQVSVHTQEFAVRDAAGQLTEEEARTIMHNDFLTLGATGVYMPFLRTMSELWYDKLSIEEFNICQQLLRKKN